MAKFIIVGLILLVVALVVWNLNKNKRGAIVLGQQMADASKKEKERIETGNFTKSPLPSFGYSRWTNEQSLINPIENELDLKITELCEEFKSYHAEKRNEVRRSISQDEIYTLLEFSKRATIFGIRKNIPSFIHNGLVAVSMIESERCDYRDVLVTLCFLTFGIQKLDLNEASAYEKVIHISEEKTGKLVREFFQRPKNTKNLQTMAGYTAIETSNGISFINTYYEKYQPERNLVKMLFDVSDFISQDKYEKGEVTIGNKIAAIWVSADNDKTIEKVISTASGCASLSAQLKNEFHPKSEFQNLLIYLAEFKDNTTLQLLTEHVNTRIPTTFSRLSFTEGNILCVLIQRAIMVNVENFETNKSVMRFEAPLRDIIR